ncbi:XdhC family protein [Neobacillus sp. NPDC093127]|uniref:XdhC family protein n=1 Tax=Neobacillus sp. NPDC093127 TaxID=3364296 RepID=UPI00381A2052
MQSNQNITERLSTMIKTNQKGVLASVVSVQGSAYKREGAKMIVRADGEYHGLISGGCLESDVSAIAVQVEETGIPMIKKYELNEELVWGLGLGCPGTVEILIEPVSFSADWKHLADAYVNAEEMVVCKVLQTKETCSPLLLVTNSDVFGNWTDEVLQEMAVSIAHQKLRQQAAAPESICLKAKNGKEVFVFFDVHFPAPQLVIFGAGDDAIPLANLSAMLGFQTTVIDPRPAFNTKERFPLAEILIAGPEKYENLSVIDSRSYIVIMNHQFERDTNALTFALQSAAPYVGLLGPRTRREKMIAHLQNQGIVFSKEEMKKLFSPIGLDIGADTSEEIGLSIMAEIIAFRNRHQGGFLREQSFIHQKPRIPVNGKR